MRLPDKQFAILLIASVLVVTAVGAVVGHDMAQLEGDVVVVDQRCGPDGRVAAFQVRVEYNGPEVATVTPHVWGEQQHVQVSWRPTPIRLEPGVQMVWIEAPQSIARVRPDTRVQVYFADGQRRLITNFNTDQCH